MCGCRRGSKRNGCGLCVGYSGSVWVGVGRSRVLVMGRAGKKGAAGVSITPVDKARSWNNATRQGKARQGLERTSERTNQAERQGG